MKRILFIFLMFVMGYSLFNMTAFSGMPNKTYSNGLGFSAMRNNVKDIFLSVKTSSSVASIVRWNVTSSTNITQIATYKETNSQSNIYYYTFFLNGYILGCLASDNTPCRVFNQSTYAYLGTLSINLSFGRGQYLTSKNIFVFAATTGQFGYFTVENLPNVTPVYVYNLSSSDFAFLEKSHDETFISVSYKTNAMVSIWRVSDWTLLKNITVGSAGVYTQAWSYDNQYLMVFIYSSVYVEIYDQYSNWTLVKNTSIGYKNIRTNFYYNETNVAIAMSEASDYVIAINWYDFSVTPIYSINGWKMYTSDDLKSFTIFQPNGGVNTAWFFNINPYCQDNTVFNIPQKKCVGKCTVGCSVCLLSSCTLCSSGYILNDGACYACAPAQVYNPLTLSCDSCSSNCNTCTSQATCTVCKSGYNLVNSACIVCPAYTVYNSTSFSCDATCTTNCQTCATSTTCATCKTNYILLSNGSCQSCPAKTYYNSISSTCVSCSANCDQCLSGIVCTVCSSGTYLVNFACITCLAGTLFNSSSSTCEANCVSNCVFCSSATTCSVCNSGYQLENNKCVACSSGTYYNNLTLSCNPCTSNCASCTSSTLCTTCQSGYELNNNECIMTLSNNTSNNNTNSNTASNTTNNTTNVVNNSTVVNNNTAVNNSSSNATNSNTNNTINNNNSTNTNDTGINNNQTNINNTTNNTNINNQTIINNNTNTNNNTTSNNITTNNNTSINNNETNNINDNITPNNNNSINQSQTANNKYNSLYEWTMGMTVQNNFISTLNTVPGSRRLIRQVFAFFLNIDHLWLYIYHKRQYGYYVNRLLQAVRNLQQEKWNIVSGQVFNSTFHIDTNLMAQNLDYKLNQTSWKYIQIEDNSSSFLENNLDFFFLNVPLVLAVFFLGKIIFHLLFKYEISLLVREYAFNGYLILMLIEGNSESFSYLFMYDSMALNETNFKEKALNVLTLFLFMFFIMQLVAGFFIIKSYYEKKAKYFYDNSATTLTGTISLLIENSFLNFCLGVAHIVLENHYNYQLLTLFLIEALFITAIVYSVKNRRLYEFKYIEWQNILASFLRILLIFTYYFDQSCPGLYEVVDEVQMYLIIIYLFNWIFSAIFAYFLLSYSLFKYIHKKFALSSAQSSKQNTEKSIDIEQCHEKFSYLKNMKSKINKVIIETINMNQTPTKKKNIRFNIQETKEDSNEQQSYPIKKPKMYDIKNKSQHRIDESIGQSKNSLLEFNRQNQESIAQKYESKTARQKSLGARSHKKLVLNKYKRDEQDEDDVQQWKDNKTQLATQLPEYHQEFGVSKRKILNKTSKEYKFNTPHQNQFNKSIRQIQFNNTPQQTINEYQQRQPRRRSNTQARKQKPSPQSIEQTIPINQKVSNSIRRTFHSKNIKLKTNRNKLKNLNSFQVTFNNNGSNL